MWHRNRNRAKRIRENPFVEKEIKKYKYQLKNHFAYSCKSNRVVIIDFSVNTETKNNNIDWKIQLMDSLQIYSFYVII